MGNKETQRIIENIPPTPFSPIYNEGNDGKMDDLIEDAFAEANKVKGYGDSVSLGVIHHIFCFCDVCEILNMSSSCRLFNIVSNSKSFWEEYYHHFFQIPLRRGVEEEGEGENAELKKINWKKQFKKRYFERNDQFYKRRYEFKEIIHIVEDEGKKKKKKKEKEIRRSIPVVIAIQADKKIGDQVTEEYVKPLLSQYFDLEKSRIGDSMEDLHDIQFLRFIFTYETRERKPIDISVKLGNMCGRSFAKSIVNYVIRLCSCDDKESVEKLEVMVRRGNDHEHIRINLRSDIDSEKKVNFEEIEEDINNAYGGANIEPTRQFNVYTSKAENLVKSFGVALDFALVNVKEKMKLLLEEQKKFSFKNKLKTAPEEFTEDVGDIWWDLKEFVSDKFRKEPNYMNYGGGGGGGLK